MIRRGLGFATVAAAFVVAAGVAGCGSSGGSSSTGGGGTIIRGTTDQPVSYDPAGAYDLPSYDAIYNIYQTVLTVPPGGNKAVPEAAQSRASSRTRPYECTIKDGLKFSDGSPLDAEDVKFSFDRNIKIADPNGASSLLANVKSVEAPDRQDRDLQPEGAGRDLPARAHRGLVRDRPGRRAERLPGRQAPARRPGDRLGPLHARLLQARPADGDREERRATPGRTPAKNDRVDHPVLRQGLGAEARGRAGRRRHRLPQPQPDGHRGPEGRETASTWSPATAPRSATWSSTTNLQPGDTDAQKLAIRQAVAYTIDRQAIADNVYNGTVKPLYSMVPQGLQFATEAFKDEYGAAPDVDAAKADPGGRGCEDARAARDLVDAVALRRRPPATSTPRSSASSTTAGCST